jgi:hypothetical protein
MSKRLLALLSVLVLASMMLAACGTPAAQPPAATGPRPLLKRLPRAPGALKIVSSFP